MTYERNCWISFRWDFLNITEHTFNGHKLYSFFVINMNTTYKYIHMISTVVWMYIGLKS